MVPSLGGIVGIMNKARRYSSIFIVVWGQRHVQGYIRRRSRTVCRLAAGEGQIRE